MGERWREGVWLGKRWTSGEDIVARKEDGRVVRTNAVKLLPVDHLTPERLDDIVGTPWDPAVKGDERQMEIKRNFLTDAERRELQQEVDPQVVPGAPIPRSTRITADVIRKLGGPHQRAINVA